MIKIAISFIRATQITASIGKQSKWNLAQKNEKLTSISKLGSISDSGSTKLGTPGTAAVAACTKASEKQIIWKGKDFKTDSSWARKNPDFSRLLSLSYQPDTLYFCPVYLTMGAGQPGELNCQLALVVTNPSLQGSRHDDELSLWE